MREVTLPLTGGSTVTLFIGSNGLAVSPQSKNPDACWVMDGIHNNGGWSVALKAEEAVALIRKAEPCW